MTETCLCSHTDDGARLSDRSGLPDVGATVDITTRQAVAHAVAGAEIVSQASMVLDTPAAPDALDETDTKMSRSCHT